MIQKEKGKWQNHDEEKYIKLYIETRERKMRKTEM